MDSVYEGICKGDYGRNRYICTQTHQDCLIFGSSRSIHHLDPVLLADSLGMTCYNCGDDGMGIVAMYGRYQLIRERYIPKVIIYDVVSSFDLLQDDKTKYIGGLRFYAENPKICQLINEVDPTEQFKMLARTYKYNGRFIDMGIQYLSKDPLLSADYTYAPLKGTMTYEVEYPAYNSASRVDSLKLSLLNTLIKSCQEDGTLLVFTISPWYAATHDLEYKPLKQLCESYGVPLLNHLQDTSFIWKKQCFKDSSHLNEEGAESFSKIVSAEIKSIYCEKEK